MHEELVSDSNFLKLSTQRQKDLIAAYCVGIEDRIRGAGSRTVAEAIANDGCGSFEFECSSSIVRRALVHRVRTLVDQYWAK